MPPEDTYRSDQYPKLQVVNADAFLPRKQETLTVQILAIEVQIFT